MDAQAVVAIGASVTLLVQMLKWAAIPDKLGPVTVFVVSALGVGLWGFSQGDFNRATTFTYFAGWVAVSATAAGIFGFTRAASTAVTAIKAPPPGGAGSDKTT